MDIKEIDKAALQSTMPDGLTPPELMLYHTLAALYVRYRADAVTKEQGQVLKKQIINAYKRMNDEYNQFKTICKQYQAEIKARYK